MTLTPGKFSIKGPLLAVQIASASMNLGATPPTQEDPDRLRELIYGEALFHSRQNDHLAAINHLQSAEMQGLLAPHAPEARLLLARMKLAYGMHLDAGLEFHALLGEDVPAPQRNRAWYELARSFFYKGYSEAAAETLSYVRGDLPADIVGDYQLLRASVLMSLDRNVEAARELEQWRGAPELAAYAYYNRGIALVRAGENNEARPALETAVKLPANGQELLALRDKARLSLGYLYARDGNYKRAGKQLKAIRADSPFSSRALLALGWIDYREGRGENALVSWTELRGRSPSDPAVLETLLVVPALYRELNATQTAKHDYREAIEAYTDELQQLRSARSSVETGTALPALLQNGSRPPSTNPAEDVQSIKRYLGPLMASRSFSEVVRGHDELQSMLETVDRGLEQVQPGEEIAANDQSPIAQLKSTSSVSRVISGNEISAPEPAAAMETKGHSRWIEGEKHPGGTATREIPQLPEVERPASRELKPLPKTESPARQKSDFSGLPSGSNYIKQPPSPEITGMPDSEILWLPKSGEFRRPGQEKEEDYAYPDTLPQRRSIPGESYGYQLTRLLPPAEEEAHFDPGAVPIGHALRELAATLNQTTEKMVELNGTFDRFSDDSEVQQRINLLHARIVKLRTRIANAITLYESYTAAMALDELDRRQLLLEDLLEQASLELAKTYDQSAGQ